VLFVDTEQGYNKLARLLVGTMLTTLFLMLTLSAQPYRQSLDNALAATAQLLLTCAFLSGIAIKLCDVSKEGQWGVAPCRDIVGLSSDAGLVAIMMIATSVVIILAALVLLMWQFGTAERPQVIRVRQTNLVPLLHLDAHQKWHLFLSHIWGSGQDQVSAARPDAVASPRVVSLMVTLCLLRWRSSSGSSGCCSRA